MINIFHKDHLEILTVTFPLLDSAMHMTRSIGKLTAKRKRSRSKPTMSTKQTEKKSSVWPLLSFEQNFGVHVQEIESLKP